MEFHSSKSFNKGLDRLSILLVCIQEYWEGVLRVNLEESDQEKLLKFTPTMDGAFKEFQEPFKGDPPEGAKKQTRQDDIVSYHIAVWALKWNMGWFGDFSLSKVYKARTSNSRGYKT